MQKALVQVTGAFCFLHFLSGLILLALGSLFSMGRAWGSLKGFVEPADGLIEPGEGFFGLIFEHVY